MARNRVLSGLNTLLITLVSTNNIPEENSNFQIPSPQDILDYIWKKLDELAHVVEDILGLDYIRKKLDDLAHIVPNFFAYLGDKLNEIFPPEMRHEVWQWILTALPFVLGGLILFACLYFFLQCFITCCWCIVRGVIFICVKCFNCFMICCGWVVGGVKYICYWGGRGGGSAAVKMMKAPGQAGALIARSVFEAAPKAYFLSLRAGNPL